MIRFAEILFLLLLLTIFAGDNIIGEETTVGKLENNISNDIALRIKDCDNLQLFKTIVIDVVNYVSQSSPTPTNDITMYLLCCEKENKLHGDGLVSNEIIQSLHKKYSYAKDISYELYIQESLTWTHTFNKFELANQALEKAELLNDDIQAKNGYEYITLYYDKGENLLLINTEVSKKLALTCFRKVLSYPIFNDIYMNSQYFNMMKEVYTKTALEYVSFCSIGELKQIHMYPFAQDVVCQENPSRGKLLPSSTPDVINNNNNIIESLNIYIQNLPQGDQDRIHLIAARNYIITQTK